MNSPLAYIGGKSKLSKTIIPQIPQHKTYIEIFGGAAWVFFRKNPSKFEVINDLDSDLVNFFKVVKNHPEEFLRQYNYTLCSREMFNELNTASTEQMTDIQKASRYFYVQRLGYGGHVRKRTFGAGSQRAPRINLIRLKNIIDEAYKRLTGVTIENLPWQEVLKRYDHEGAFFYIDPPYFKCPYYKHNMQYEDFEKLSESLKTIRGKFILSINDTPEMRDVFSRYKIQPVTIGYSISKNENTPGRELLITGRN